METTSETRFGYSEQQMADAFLELLRSPGTLPVIGPFDGIYREVSCSHGRPDFIALRNKTGCEIKPLPKTTGLVDASILGLLTSSSPRTLKYIMQKSEFSADSITRSLRQLLASGHIEKTKIGSYILGSATCQFATEIWAFELKLDKPKRAVFQAQQSRAFAERSIIVVPPGQEKNYQRYSETMKRWGIGLATFDPLVNKFSMITRPRKSCAFSRQHQIYVIMGLTQQKS